MSKHGGLTLVAATLALLSAPSMPLRAQSTAAAKVGIPAGSYTTTIKRADVSRRVPAAQRDSMPGQWVIAFDAAGHFTVQHDGNQIAEGDARATANRVRFDANEKGNGACRVKATYRYSVKRNALTFSKVTDSCAPRVVVLTSHPLKRG